MVAGHEYCSQLSGQCVLALGGSIGVLIITRIWPLNFMSVYAPAPAPPPHHPATGGIDHTINTENLGFFFYDNFCWQW